MIINIKQSDIVGIYEKDGNSLSEQLKKCKFLDEVLQSFQEHSITTIDEKGNMTSYVPSLVIYQWLNLNNY